MVNAISKEILEGNGNFDDILAVETDILDEAEVYHATTEELETVTEQPVVAEPEKDSSRFQDMWAKMDVNLGEMVKNVFETSERLIFIVCDDNVVYQNKKARSVLEIDDFQQNSKGSFFNFVDQEDWKLLADNIGGLLMEQKTINIRLKTARQKIVPLGLSAVYLPDISHFSFILIGKLQQKTEKAMINPLYDVNTGLPNFFLFEDRLLMAVNAEKDKPLSEVNKMAVLAVSIDNIDVFRNLQTEDVLYKKLACQLAMISDKRGTVARGLKYPFWCLLPIVDEVSLNDFVAKVKGVLDEGISDNFNKHEIAYSIGYTLFPSSAPSAKKLVQQTIQAVEKAKKVTGNTVVEL